MAKEATELLALFTKVKERYANRDARMSQIKAIREGRVSDVAPGLFPDSGVYQEPIVANEIDSAARNLAEAIAPLPNFDCLSPSMTSESSRQRATKRTKIANGYVAHSQLKKQMLSAADTYITYGILPFRVEVDYKSNMPMIRALNPVGAYPIMDRFGRTTAFFQKISTTRDQLTEMYPDKKGLIDNIRGRDFSTPELVEVVFYHDAYCDTAFVVGANPFTLDYVSNPVGKCMVRVAQRPGVTDIPRGQFDDVIFIQLAKNRLAMLALQAAKDAVNAPLVVPSDVSEVNFGPGSTIFTNNPAGVGRVPLEVPREAFAEQDILSREFRMGARSPEVLSGSLDASIVTGQGVDSLLGGYNGQIKAHQIILESVLQECVSLCFELDEVVFGSMAKDLRGKHQGRSYQITYTPSVDIDGDYTNEVSYGLMAGLDANRALIFGLQARNDGLISQDFLRRELPFDINVEEEKQQIDIEEMDNAAKQAVMGYAQAIPALAANGQDPRPVLDILSRFSKHRRKGKSASESVTLAFEEQQEEQQKAAEQAAAAQAEAAQAQGQIAAGPESPDGLTSDGRMPGVAPGQIGELPGTRPDLAQMMAGMNAQGDANLSYTISKQRAV